MKNIVTLLFIVCFICVSVHEFWLQPDKFFIKKTKKQIPNSWSQLTVKVLFNKEPLVHNKTTRVQMQTDEYGLAGFLVKTSGKWMVSVIKMIHLQNEPKANWQSYWGSCTWAIHKLQVKSPIFAATLMKKYEHSRQ